MCIYTYRHIHIHIYMYMYIYIHIQVYINICSINQWLCNLPELHVVGGFKYSCLLQEASVSLSVFSDLFKPPEEGKGIGFPRKQAILADCTT